MDKPSVYLETSFFSYLTARPSNNFTNAYRQQKTSKWWEARNAYSLHISLLVEDECSRGDEIRSHERINALQGIRLLDVTDEVELLAKHLILSHSLPPKAGEDALHIAIAAVHRVDYLLTWNMKHIANPHSLPLIWKTIESEGYPILTICTPDYLLEESEENE